MTNQRNPDETEPKPAEESEASVEERIAELEKSLREKAEEAEANWGKYLREAADCENLKKRLQREKTEAVRYANESLILDVLPVLDNLELALEHADASGTDGESVMVGVEMVLRLFRDTLERNGVTPIEAEVGSVADWNLHDACGAEEREDMPQNTVLSTQQKGYRLHDRVIRPARVVVAKPPAEPSKPTENPEE